MSLIPLFNNLGKNKFPEIESGVIRKARSIGFFWSNLVAVIDASEVTGLKVTIAWKWYFKDPGF